MRGLANRMSLDSYPNPSHCARCPIVARRKTQHFGLLKSTRKTLGLSQHELGVALGVSRNTVRSWEGCREDDFLRHICRGLRECRIMPHLETVATGQSVAAVRAGMRLHQDEFSALLGVSRSTVSRWENDTPPRWVSFALLSLAFTD
ncbi:MULTISPECIES: helix-turn-helix domain-containing protein [Pseudomonas]|uniref:helix-turn-helix domain-containing protein n=1 Tax=Pseudomonas TaxID=286 RepID=UPI0009E732D8